MIDHIKKLIKEADEFSGDSLSAVEDFRVKFLGKKGVVNDLFEAFKAVPNNEKKAYGQAINELKKTAQERVNALKKKLA